MTLDGLVKMERLTTPPACYQSEIDEVLLSTSFPRTRLGSLLTGTFRCTLFKISLRTDRIKDVKRMARAPYIEEGSLATFA
jgi:hypothetical protein